MHKGHIPDKTMPNGKGLAWGNAKISFRPISGLTITPAKPNDFNVFTANGLAILQNGPAHTLNPLKEGKSDACQGAFKTKLRPPFFKAKRTRFSVSTSVAGHIIGGSHHQTVSLARP